MRLADYVERYRIYVLFVAGNLAFAAVLVTLVLSAYHQPQPHGLPVGVVAPAQVTRHLQATLGAHAPGAFDLHSYLNTASARTAILHRDIDAAVIAGPGGLRLLTAEAGGVAPAQAITAAFGAVAAKTGHALAVTDVVPPLARDSEALSPFFLLLGVLFPGLVAGSASALAFRHSGPAWAVAAPVVAAAAAGLAAAGIAAGVTGFGNYLAVAGVVALFFLAVSAPTAFFARVSPGLVALAVLIFIVFGIPVSGGPSGLASFGPGFLRVLDPALPLGVGADALRNTVYFHGYETTRYLWVLAAWAGVGVAALALVSAVRHRTARGRAAAAPARHAAVMYATSPAPVDLVVGVDGSEQSRHALDWAVGMLGDRPGALHAVYVDHPAGGDLSGFGYQEMAEARQRAAADVQALVAATATQAGITWAFERRDGSPAEEILAAAKDRAGGPGTIIVVGRAAHPARHPIGSVPVRLMHHSAYPVLVIR
ncbi:MAG TPA: universal stress protein [Streptosporangiaceae bacterium]|nr:universal stress protein [Streptosporangiaceae bacterium]